MKIKSIILAFTFLTLIGCESEENKVATDLSDSVLLNNQELNDGLTEYLILQNDLEGIEEEASEREDDNSNQRMAAADKKRGKAKKGKHRPFAHYHCASISSEMNWDELQLTKVYDFSNGGCEGSDIVMDGVVTDIIDLDTTATLTTYTFSTTFEGFTRDNVVMEGSIVRVKTWEPMDELDLEDPKSWMKNKTTTGSLTKDITITFPASEEYPQGWSETIQKDLMVETNEGEKSRIGTITYSNSLGQGYTTVITTPRVFTKNCEMRIFFPVSGIEEVTTLDGTQITINYGDGTCDTLAEITIDGITEIIDLEEIIENGKIDRSAILSRLQ